VRHRTTAPTWHSWGGLINAAPDALTFTNFVSGELAVVRGVGNQIYYRHGDAGVASGPWRSLGGYATSAPSAADSANYQLIAVRGVGNQTYYRYSGYLANGTVGWAPWESLGGVATSAPAAAFLGGYKNDLRYHPVYVFVRGLNDAIDYRSGEPGSWSPWQTLGGHFSSAPAAIGASIGGLDRFYIFARGLDNKLYYRTLRSGWQSLGGVLASAPDAFFDEYRLVVAALGPDHAVHYRTLTKAGGSCR
jgi:hypothetical protein